MVFVTRDKLQLHSFSHVTDDFYARSMLYMHHVSNCMILGVQADRTNLG
jgi:hypothetical protein